MSPAATLSQSDIDGLLRAPAASPAPAKQAAQDVQLYDFRRPNRVSREAFRTLEAMYESLGRSLESWLITRVRDTVHLKLQGVEQISFAEFLLSLSAPSCSFLVDAEDQGDQAVIDFGQELGSFLIDRLFGGSRTPTMITRALSPLERMALRSVADRVLSELTGTWADHQELKVSIGGFESVPEILQAVGRDDPVLVASYEASFESGSSVLSICIPLSLIEGFFTDATRRTDSRIIGTTASRDAMRAQTEAALNGASVRLTARLPEFRIAVRELVSLRAGTVISTGIPIDTPLHLLLGDQPRFEAMAGKIRSQRALRVLRPLPAPAIDASMLASLSIPPKPHPAMSPASAPITESPTAPGVTANPAELVDLGAASLAGGEVPLGALVDLGLPVRIEVGRTAMTVGDLLKLGRGSVIKLDRMAGDPMDLYVSDLHLAEGEVVVVNEHYGFRLRRIVAQLPVPTAG